MPLAPEPGREQPGTYVIEDRGSQEEMKRLQLFDQLFTAGVGGVLPEQPASAVFSHVLDVGCGTGGWLIQLAQSRLTCQVLVGVDASLTFIEYARTQARAAQVSDRVEFYVGDALRMLEFPSGFFDLVNSPNQSGRSPGTVRLSCVSRIWPARPSTRQDTTLPQPEMV